MGNQKNLKIVRGLKLLSIAFIAQGLVACGGDGVFSGKRSFANKNLDAIQVTESDEAVLGLDSEDIETGEEVTSIQGDGENYDLDTSEDYNGEAGDYEDGIEDGTEGGENQVVENCPGKSKCNGKKYGAGDQIDEGDYPADNPGRAKKQGGGNYICILDGPGKSIRLGLVDDTPAGQTGTPDVICMSQAACLGEVSKAFDVKLAHRRGFCPNKNKHVVQMSDEEVAMMIEKLED